MCIRVYVCVHTAHTIALATARKSHSENVRHGLAFRNFYLVPAKINRLLKTILICLIFCVLAFNNGGCKSICSVTTMSPVIQHIAFGGLASSVRSFVHMSNNIMYDYNIIIYLHYIVCMCYIQAIDHKFPVTPSQKWFKVVIIRFTTSKTTNIKQTVVSYIIFMQYAYYNTYAYKHTMLVVGA